MVGFVFFIIGTFVLLLLLFNGTLVSRRLLNSKWAVRGGEEITNVEYKLYGSKGMKHYKGKVIFKDGTSYMDDVSWSDRHTLYYRVGVDKEKIPKLIEDALKAHEYAVIENEQKEQNKKRIEKKETEKNQPIEPEERRDNSLELHKTEDKAQQALFCRKCGKRLMPSIAVCQYCGTEIIDLTAREKKTRESHIHNSNEDASNSLEKPHNYERVDYASEFSNCFARSIIGESIENYPNFSQKSDDYGLCASNPILVHGRDERDAFISNLRRADGGSIVWIRIGSTSEKDVPGSTDVYSGQVNGKQVAKVYINAYCKENYAKAPNGLLL